MNRVAPGGATSVGLRGGCLDGFPRTSACDRGSCKRRLRTSTSSPKLRKKSAPRMANFTSATTKIHRNVLLSPRSSERERCPYVGIVVLLTACNGAAHGRLRSAGDAGTTLTSAPVSTRKRAPLSRSVRKNTDGRLSGRAGALVTLSAGPGRFPNFHRAAHSSVQRCRICGGTSTPCVVVVVMRYAVVVAGCRSSAALRRCLRGEKFPLASLAGNWRTVRLRAPTRLWARRQP